MTLSSADLDAAISAAERGDLRAVGRVLRSMKAEAAYGVQAAAISDPSGGATVDAEARTAINAIIAALEAKGIVAS